MAAELLDLGQVVGGQQHTGTVVRGEVRDDAAQVAGDGGVEAERRLVEEEVVGAVDESPGDGEPLGHAARVTLDHGVGGVGQADELEEFTGPAAQFGPRDVVELAEVPEVLAAGHAGVDHALATGDEVDAAAYGAGVGDRVRAVDTHGAGRWGAGVWRGS